MGKLLLIGGLIIAVIGLMLIFNIHIPYLGKLPGDIFIQRGNMKVYFPVVTCIVISVILSLLFYLFSGR